MTCSWTQNPAQKTEPVKNSSRPTNEVESSQANRLIREKSPYLLQHAYNPVQWYPWGPEAFEKARRENKVIFLSIGYSTCYWCHVMEREVFENEAIAAVMNRNFVNIKVDREERPDIDRIYMNALQTISGRGGWPMSMFLTPDLKPFYGATYIPAPSFQHLMQQVDDAWRKQPEKIEQYGEQLTSILKRGFDLEAVATSLSSSTLDKGFQAFRGNYDPRFAGFGSAPKFPRPVTFNFLLSYYWRFQDPKALEMTLTTLRKMGEGGIFDHIAGGFHRYSVDQQWRVPHFEKMLYDQAQLARSYLDAYQITRKEFYSSVARLTLDYVLQNLTHPEGGFYSAEDAESAPDPRQPDRKKEGAFYVWTEVELDRLLDGQASPIFKFLYGVRSTGNALEDIHQVFTGKNILYLAHSVETAARKFNQSVPEMRRILAKCRGRLQQARQERTRPHLDDKSLASWNGLMISSLARAHQVLEEPRYLEAARRAGDFVIAKLYDSSQLRLKRRYRDGDARYEGLLEDYSFLVQGFIDLYEASLETRWLRLALELTQSATELFLDRTQGGFFDTTGTDRSLLLRTKESYDGAEPTGSSVMTLNLLRLAHMTDNGEWRRMAKQTLELFAQRLTASPQSTPQMLAALAFYLDKPKQIIIVGKYGEKGAKALLRQAHQVFLPHKIVLLVNPDHPGQLVTQRLPFTKSMKMLEGKATVFVCEDYACQLPTTDPKVMARLLSNPPVQRISDEKLGPELE